MASTKITGILKTTALKDELKKQITKMLPGDALLPEQQLANLYQVGRVTVRRAIADLVNEGVLFRVQGRGTFVTERRKSRLPTELVGLFMPTQGHLYAEMSHSMVQSLQNGGYFPIVVDIHDPENLEERIKKVLDMGIGAALVDGFAYFPFDILSAYSENTQSVFFGQYERQTDFPNASYVLSDYIHGGNIAANHLFALGHQKIIILTHEWAGSSPERIGIQLFEGCKKACLKRNYDPEIALVPLKVGAGSREDAQRLKQVLQKSSHPTAIFAFGDNRALGVFKAAKDLGMAIPRDLAIMGYGNTPWCEMLDIPLTSVSMQENRIASFACGMVTNWKKTGNKKIIKPRLVIRESCGAGNGEA